MSQPADPADIDGEDLESIMVARFVQPKPEYSLNRTATTYEKLTRRLLPFHA